MECPNCRHAAPEGASECPSCGLVFAKWRKRQEATAPQEQAPAPAAAPLGPLALLALAPALLLGWRFSSSLPMPEAWGVCQKVLFPLAFADLAFHEGGHIVFGIPGDHALMVAGGTLMQLGMPLACLAHFWRRGSRASCWAVLFWLGYNLVEVSYYAADAKLQALILITGMSGSEGGMHDWNFLLSWLGLLDHSVGIGLAFFLAGWWLMAFTAFRGLAALVRKK